MAYNPTLYNPYGTPYGNTYTAPNLPVQPQSFTPETTKGAIEWVDGEVGAKAYQIPQGTTKPIALWDTNDTVIYLKSMNPMGMPNPLQKIHYTMEESTPKPIEQSGTQRLMSGDTAPHMDMSDYAKKDDLERMKEEIIRVLREDKTEVVPSKHGVKGE